MKILITAGPTREAIDPVRYIGNRSSGKMGAALAQAGLRGGHTVSVIAGPIAVALPEGIERIDVESAAQMHAAVMQAFPAHDLLIMAAAVADYRPVRRSSEKLTRRGRILIECEATEDIVAAASAAKRGDQRTVGFSLESGRDLDRAVEKLGRKGLDMIVYNSTQAMDSATVEAVLLWPDGRQEPLPCRSKVDFADILLKRAGALFGKTAG